MNNYVLLLLAVLGLWSVGLVNCRRHHSHSHGHGHRHKLAEFWQRNRDGDDDKRPMSTPRTVPKVGLIQKVPTAIQNTLPSNSLLVQNDLAATCNRRTSSRPNNSLPLCCVSLDEFPSGRPLAGNVVHPRLPGWLNLTLARQGQAFAVKNRFSVTMAAGYGLLVGLSAPDARNVLAFTGNSDTREKAIKRYVATCAQMLVWFDETFTDNMDDNLILESIAHVREIHTRVARGANAARKPLAPDEHFADVATDDELWKAIKLDLEASKLNVHKAYRESYTKYDGTSVAINQFMQGFTGAGFWAYLLMDPTSVFIWDATQAELKGYLHLWAVISYMMGVDDEYNMSLQPTPAEAAAFLTEAQGLYLVPELFAMHKSTKVLMEALAIEVDVRTWSVGLRRVWYMVLTTLFKIPATNVRALFTVTQELAQRTWETVFVPSTKVPFTRAQINKAFTVGFGAIQTGLFGLYPTRKDIVDHVYYPNVTFDAHN